jgi:hypothetical protein
VSDAIFGHFISGVFLIDPRKFPENSGFVCFWFGKLAILAPKRRISRKTGYFAPFSSGISRITPKILRDRSGLTSENFGKITKTFIFFKKPTKIAPLRVTKVWGGLRERSRKEPPEDMTGTRSPPASTVPISHTPRIISLPARGGSPTGDSNGDPSPLSPLLALGVAIRERSEGDVK